MTLEKPRRRLFRFGLRAFLLFVLVIAVALGMVTWTIHEARKQGIAVAALERMGCVFAYSENDSPTVLECLRMWFDENETRNIEFVYAIDKPTQLTDAGLIYLQGLTRLTHLDLSETKVTDAGLVRLRGLAKLEYLRLDGTQVTDAGLVQLYGLTQLACLSLERTQVTDTGVKELQVKLPNLQVCR